MVGGSRQTSDELAALGNEGEVPHVSVDLTSDQGPSQLVSAALDVGPIDILVNNAGAVTPRLEGFVSVTNEQWRGTMNLSFMAAVRTTRALLPQMIARGDGSIVNNASVNATLRPLRHRLQRCKGCARQLLEGAVQGGRTSGDPGQCRERRPGLYGSLVGREWGGCHCLRSSGFSPNNIARRAVEEAATGRFTTPEEIADLIVFLASSRASNVTGADYIIDGGLSQGV